MAVSNTEEEWDRLLVGHACSTKGVLDCSVNELFPVVHHPCRTKTPRTPSISAALLYSTLAWTGLCSYLTSSH